MFELWKRRWLEASWMALMMASLYDALKAANVDDDKARRAAEEVANYDGAINSIERKVTVLDGRVTALDGRVAMLQWMVGFNLALTTAILFKVFS
jgi:hypothetical protein